MHGDIVDADSMVAMEAIGPTDDQPGHGPRPKSCAGDVPSHPTGTSGSMLYQFLEQ